MKKPHSINRISVAFRITACLFLTGLSLVHLPAEDRTWSSGTGTDFNNGSNYSPTGAIGGTADLIFDMTTNPALDLDAALAINSLHIDAGGDGFNLSTGNASGLVVNDGGIIVAASTTATIGTNVSSNGAATHLTFNVGTGGTLNVNGFVAPVSRTFHKMGTGLLYMAVGAGTNTQNYIRTGASINIDEGTLEVGNAAQFEPGTSFAVGTLIVSVGTGTTTGTLKGGGSFVGVASKPVQVNTFGTTRSIINPAGDGTLAIENLNVAAGATFQFDLGTDLIFGTGTLTGSTAAGGMAFDLTGGTTGVWYTLFQYGSSSGVDITDFAINTAGYTGASWDLTDGDVKVQFSAIPEPSYVGFMLVLGLAWMIKRNLRVKSLT